MHAKHGKGVVLDKEVDMEKGIDRRGFVVGTVAAAACAGASRALAAEYTRPIETGSIPTPNEVAETLETDVCVIGSGLSGLACAVQAAQNGLDVLVLEKSSSIGGNANVIEGTFGIGDDMAKEAGIEVTVRQVLDHEMSSSQYRVDGALWRRFLDSAADNMNWLVECGCEFTGAIETYGGLYETFHWYKDGEGAYGYIPQMSALAESLGVEFMTSTPATKLICEDGRTVTGCYATDADDRALRVNAKVTVVATGGWGSNPDLIARQGFDVTDYHQGGLPFHDGDGYLMALDLGADDRLPVASQLALNIIPALPKSDFKHPYNGITGISSGMQPSIWVNQDGVRFSNETVLMQNMMLQTIPCREQKASYTLFDQAIWDSFTEGMEGCDPASELAAAVEANDPPSLWKADTLEELAELVGIDPETLAATVAEYNADCETGEGDSVFNRDASTMVAIQNPPYYIGRNRVHYVGTFGGVATDGMYRPVDSDGQPFGGVHVIGTDGEMRYRNVYPINIGGTASAGCIWSGRLAANCAKEYIG